MWALSHSVVCLRNTNILPVSETLVLDMAKHDVRSSYEI
jgi:hypothetical protein